MQGQRGGVALLPHVFVCLCVGHGMPRLYYKYCSTHQYEAASSSAKRMPPTGAPKAAACERERGYRVLRMVRGKEADGGDPERGEQSIIYHRHTVAERSASEGGEGVI